jgi:peptidyl-prolyl cis-trans isomerase B (cyclophilin B)
VTSNRNRRAAARARLERDRALRAEVARRRRRTRTIIAASAAAVVLVGAVVWVAVANSGDDKKKGKASPKANPSASASSSGCNYRPLVDPSASGSPEPTPSGVREVGKPAADVPRSGKQIMAVTTNQGLIKVEMDLSKVPCTAASFTHLAGTKFYDNTKCHRIVPSIGALQCGDPAGTGAGGPTYRFADENLPVNRRPAYAAGSVAMANTGQPESNGSQFFFVFKDSDLQPQYTLIGKVIEGMDVLKKIADAGIAAGAQSPNEGPPKLETVIQSLTVSAPAA